MATKSESTAIPAKLFGGKKVCIAGRFSYHPSKSDLVKFLKAEGAKVENAVSAKTDLLIVGEGAKSAAQKKAETLNAKGSLIEICDDLTALLGIDFSQSPEIITNAKLLERIGGIPDYFFPSGQAIAFRGDDFSKQSIGSSAKKIVTENFGFESCKFDRASLKNVSFDPDRFGIGARTHAFTHCSFDGANLHDVGLASLNSCSFKKSLADKIEFEFFVECSVDSADVKNANGRWIEDSTFSKTTFTNLALEGYGGNIVRSKFSNCIFLDSKIYADEHEELSIQESSFAKCKFENVDFGTTEIGDCEFTQVEFRNCKFTHLVFSKCKLTNCKFLGCSGGTLDVSGSDVSKCTAKDLHAALLNMTDKQVPNFKGIDDSARAADVSKLSQMKQLATLAQKSSRLQFTFDGSTVDGETVSVKFDREWSYDFSYHTAGGTKRHGSFSLSNYRSKVSQADIVLGLLRLVRESGLADMDLKSLKTKTSKCAVPPRELKQQVVQAIYEALGKPPQSEEELLAAQKQAKSEATQLRKEMQAELSAEEVGRFNKRPAAQRKQAGSIKKLKLAGKNLQKLSASHLDLSESDFSGANLSGSNFSQGALRKCNLKNADLTGANLKGNNLRGSDLTSADLSKANLQQATLNDCQTKNAVLAAANLQGTNLCGVDFSGAKLDGAKLKNACYDEKTQLPKSMKVADMKAMRWVGGGIPPHERKQNKKTSGPINFEQFMARLNEITDSSRLSKSTQMLKKDAFQLFSDVSDTAVAGVVKSQSDKDLVYSCTLDESGDFACCTQNLNACGGLRGALCKHILVLVVGLAKSGELDPTKIDEWVNSSKLKQPKLDKDRMSEVLLKYKGAEAGEIDWRPTETVPEDFFAF